MQRMKRKEIISLHSDWQALTAGMAKAEFILLWDREHLLNFCFCGSVRGEREAEVISPKLSCLQLQWLARSMETSKPLQRAIHAIFSV